MIIVMRYIRMYKGTEAGAPGVTLYEIDRGGWVHRQLQINAETVRFSPEDILLRRPVRVAQMAAHPDAEEISVDEFERLWVEFEHRRRFRSRVPNPWRAWTGRIAGATASTWTTLRWSPSQHPGEGWQRVPGFVRLYVLGDVDTAWTTQAELFLEREIEWIAAAPELGAPASRGPQFVEGLGLGSALRHGGVRSPEPVVGLA